jgi:hypothetical protein
MDFAKDAVPTLRISNDKPGVRESPISRIRPSIVVTKTQKHEDTDGTKGYSPMTSASGAIILPGGSV